MSTKKKSKLKLEELFSASSFGVCLYIKSDLHKILDNFYLNGFHIEETTSYDSTQGYQMQKEKFNSKITSPEFFSFS